MEEIHRVRVWERARSFQGLSGHTTPAKSLFVHQSRISLNLVLLGFYGGFII